jgi:AbrB family looped-hinge helix DNA binding protein
MSLVKVKTKGQVTLPTRLREQAGLSVGDLLEAKLEKSGKITLTPQSLVDRHIAESMEQINKGEFYGPFDTAEEMIKSLHQHSKRSKKTTKRAARK